MASRRIPPMIFALLSLAPLATWAETGAAEENRWFAGGRAAAARASALHPDAGRARSVILFVGDGMNISTISAARILSGQLRGESGEESSLSFEALPYVALAKTYNTDQQVPDSAGTMTALVSGVKTKAGVLGVDERVVRGDAASARVARVPTLCEQAEEHGMATGVVTTTRVTHATAAACFVHTAHRDWESDSAIPVAQTDTTDLARQMLEFSGDGGVEVILGGGAAMFRGRGDGGKRNDGRDLVAEWRTRHPDAVFVDTRDALERATADTRGGPLLGLFAPSHLAFEAERGATTEPSLSEMTVAAIDRLATHREGYVLIVEGGRIDHAHHLGNAQRALLDTLEFSNAIAAALARIPRDETLVVVTADHGHVFAIAGYPKRGNDILGYVVPPGTSEPSLDLRGAPYPTLAYTNGPGASSAPAAASDDRRAKIRAELDTTGSSGASAHPPEHLDYRQPAAIPLAIETHSGEDVPIYAGGPGAALFHGVQEQHYVYHAIVEALGWNEAAARPDPASR